MLDTQNGPAVAEGKAAARASHDAPRPPKVARPGALKRALKRIASAIGLAVAAPAAASCWLESSLGDREELFHFWGQAFAVVPGLPGKYLRRGFYRLTLASCSEDCDLGFLCQFTDRRAEVGRRAYVGIGTILGRVSVGDGALIGSRASIPSGRNQHRLGLDGRLTPFDPAAAEHIRIGEETWIGEAAVIMADVGSRCVVAAGAVITGPIPDCCLVGGNPARLIRRLRDDELDAPGEEPGR